MLFFGLHIVPVGVPVWLNSWFALQLVVGVVTPTPLVGSVEPDWVLWDRLGLGFAVVLPFRLGAQGGCFRSPA